MTMSKHSILHNKGKKRKFSKEHISRLRLCNIGKKRSKETKRKISIANKGKKLSKKHKKNLSIAIKKYWAIRKVS